MALLLGVSGQDLRSQRKSIASQPPMGWNSWDCYGTTVREAEVKANTDYMASRLKRHGWQYIVVDIQWSDSKAKAHGYRPNADLTMDAYGRLVPATKRFPSAADGHGFKPLADYAHQQGLKFGIHIMRGIPRQAVRTNTPIEGNESELNFPMEFGYVRRGHEQTGRAGLLRFHCPVVCLLGPRFH